MLLKPLRQDLLAELGPLPERTSLDLVIHAKRKVWGYEEWKVEFAAETGDERQAVSRIPAYILIPKWQGESPYPAMVCLHQCNVDCTLAKEAVAGKTVETTPDQHYAVELVNEGFVVLAPDSINCGERHLDGLRAEGESIPCWDQMEPVLGRSWLGKRVWDASRSVDVLESLDFVDSDRIGLVGHSMGAHTGLHAMAYDGRFQACILSGAVPSKYLPLHAPRLHIALHGLLDTPDLNPEAAETFTHKIRDSYAAARTHYQAQGKGDRLILQELPIGHHFDRHFKWMAYSQLRSYFGTAPVEGPVSLQRALDRARRDNWAWDRDEAHFPPVQIPTGLTVWGNEEVLVEGFKFLFVHAYQKLDGSQPSLIVQVRDQDEICQIWCGVPARNLNARVAFVEDGEKNFVTSGGSLRSEIEDSRGYLVVTLPKSNPQAYRMPPGYS